MIAEHYSDFAPRCYVLKYGGRPVFVSEFGWTESTTDAFRKAELPNIRFRGLTGQRIEVSPLGAISQGIRALYLSSAGYLGGVRQFDRTRRLVIDQYPENGVEFGGFPELEVIYTAWNRRFSKAIFQVSNLRKLSVEDAFPEEDCRHFSVFPELRRLSFTAGLLKTPDGLEACTKLEHIELVRCAHLTGLGDLRAFSNLSSLSLERLPNLHWHTPLCSLRNLKRLRFKEIPGLCQKLDLVGLSRLESVSVINCRNASVDLGGLGEMPNLKSLWLNVPHSNLSLDALFTKPALKNVGFLERDELSLPDERLKRMAWARGKRIRTIQRTGQGRSRQIQIVFADDPVS